MQNRREAVLQGTLEAARLHAALQTREQIAVQGGRVDVFGAIIHQGAELIFRKLDGLLGAYVPVPHPGILVTTERPLAVQRFTAAHELGHYSMKNATSLDDEAVIQQLSASLRIKDLNEVAANAFASEFLMPEWLVGFHAERQSWELKDLQSPATVYQLSLRTGVSYEAVCRILEGHGLLTKPVTVSLLAVERKKIKQQLLGSYSPPDWRLNVWILTERDEGSVIYGEPNDIFVVRLNEHSGAGYIWNLEQIAAAGFSIVSDERRAVCKKGEIGGEVERVLTAQSPEGVTGSLNLVESRPWDESDSFGHFSFGFDFRGKEFGMPRTARERLVAA